MQTSATSGYYLLYSDDQRDWNELGVVDFDAIQGCQREIEALDLPRRKRKEKRIPMRCTRHLVSTCSRAASLTISPFTTRQPPANNFSATVHHEHSFSLSRLSQSVLEADRFYRSLVDADYYARIWKTPGNS